MPGSEAPHYQDWHAEALWLAMTPLLPDISIEVLARTESTNSTLLERVRNDSHSGAPLPYGRRSHDMQPCLLVAEQQTHGRGRLGRAWLSGVEGSSLTFSLGLPMAVKDWSGLSLAVGAAIADALEPDLAPGQSPQLMLKWPNDIWLGGRKLGGILIETVPAGPQRMVIIGVGLNIKPVSEDFEASPSQYQTGFATLSELQPGLSAPAALALIAPAMARALLDFQAQGFAAGQAAYARRDLTLGRPVSAGNLQGISHGISASGELMIETADQGLQAVTGGEVSLRFFDDDTGGAN